MSNLEESANRVKAYLNERTKSRGTNHEPIHGLQVGSDREAFLLASDLQALLDAVQDMPIYDIMKEAAARTDDIVDAVFTLENVAEIRKRVDEILK